jgi:hypothetical protein
MNRLWYPTDLDEYPYRAQVQCPPPSPPLAPVVTRAAPPAHPTPTPLPPTRSYRRHDDRLAFVELDTLNHRLLDPEQPGPYPCTTHAVLRAYSSDLRQAKTMAGQRRALITTCRTHPRKRQESLN